MLFDFMALSLAVSEKVRFRVKLEGQDEDWRKLVNQRHVHYTNLSPNPYRLSVSSLPITAVSGTRRARRWISPSRRHISDELVSRAVRRPPCGAFVGGVAAASPATGTTTGDDLGRAYR